MAAAPFLVRVLKVPGCKKQTSSRRRGGTFCFASDVLQTQMHHPPTPSLNKRKGGEEDNYRWHCVRRTLGE